jgi:FtsZ-binding cell division protein ZapB
MRCLFLLLVLFYTAQSTKAQIKWSADRPLVWDDFKGPIDQSSEHTASTYGQYKYSYMCHRTGDKYAVKVKLDSWFDESISWKKPDKLSDALLKHEQIHFDIHELYARKMEKAFNDYKYTSDYQNELKDIFQKYLEEERSMQAQYDSETNHSKIKDKQLEWEERVYNLLLKNPPL